MQVGVVIVVAIAILVQHIGQVIGIGDECLGHQTVNLKCSSLQSHAAIAFAVVGGYAVPCSAVALRVGSAPYCTVKPDKVVAFAFLIKLLIKFSHIAFFLLYIYMMFISSDNRRKGTKEDCYPKPLHRGFS